MWSGKNKEMLSGHAEMGNESQGADGTVFGKGCEKEEGILQVSWPEEAGQREHTSFGN